MHYVSRFEWLRKRLAIIKWRYRWHINKNSSNNVKQCLSRSYCTAAVRAANWRRHTSFPHHSYRQSKELLLIRLDEPRRGDIFKLKYWLIHRFSDFDGGNLLPFGWHKTPQIYSVFYHQKTIQEAQYSTANWPLSNIRNAIWTRNAWKDATSNWFSI